MSIAMDTKLAIEKCHNLLFINKSCMRFNHKTLTVNMNIQFLSKYPLGPAAVHI
jgi:hypothetical protein